MSNNVNKHCRVYSDAGFKLKHIGSIVKNCLFAFPNLWVSVVRGFIYNECLMILDVA